MISDLGLWTGGAPSGFSRGYVGERFFFSKVAVSWDSARRISGEGGLCRGAPQGVAKFLDSAGWILGSRGQRILLQGLPKAGAIGLSRRVC